MGGISLERLIYDPADAASPNVGAYLRDAAGNHLTSTLISGKQALDVNILSGTDDGVFDEDSASADADKGVSVFKVRQDTLTTLVSTDGDYEWFKGNSRGALWTAPVGTVDDGSADTEYPVKVGSKAVSSLSALTNGQRANLISDLYRRVFINDAANRLSKATAISLGTSALPLPATPLAGRVEVTVQNLSNVDIYIGDSAVTSASGTKISKGGSGTYKLGEGCLLYAIAAAGTGNDVRVLELA